MQGFFVLSWYSSQNPFCHKFGEIAVDRFGCSVSHRLSLAKYLKVSPPGGERSEPLKKMTVLVHNFGKVETLRASSFLLMLIKYSGLQNMGVTKTAVRPAALMSH